VVDDRTTSLHVLAEANTARAFDSVPP